MIKKLRDDGKADLIHQPIPVSPRAPSRIYGLGVPVIIGPMNGNMNYPEGYEDYESRISRMFIPGGSTFSQSGKRSDPWQTTRGRLAGGK